MYFWMKAQLTNIPVAPVDVETDHREVVVQSSMAMLRAWTDLDRTYMDGEGALQAVVEVLTPASFWVHLCSLMFLT